MSLFACHFPAGISPHAQPLQRSGVWPVLKSLNLLRLLGLPLTRLTFVACPADSGLSLVISQALTGLGGLPLTLVMFITTLVVTFLTELTSNTATASIMIPVLASAADGLGVHPLALLLPGTFATGCAFMLPIATPPNAIVYATNRLQFTSMLGGGFVINLVAVLVIVLFTQTVAKSVFGVRTWAVEQ